MKRVFKNLIAIAALAAIVLPAPAGAAVIVKPAPGLGLIGHWAFDDEAGTTATDHSGNGNHGTLTNSPTWATGKRAGALAFNGGTAYVSIPTAGASASAGTISFWAKSSDAAHSGYLVNTVGTNERIYLGWSNSSIYMLMGSGANTIATAFNVSTGAWHHVTGTWSGTSGTLYVDGQLVGSGSFTALASVLNPMYVGGFAGSQGFNGTIDDVRIYSRALSASEAATLYRAGATKRVVPNNLSLAAHYSLDEGSGTQAGDMSGNGRHASFQGSPSWVAGRGSSAVSTNNTVSDYVDAPNVAVGSAWTAMAWFKYPLATAGGSWHTLFRGSGGGDHHIIVQRSDMRLGMYANVAGSGFRTSGFNMATLSNGWHHIAAVGSGGIQLMYIDGVLVGQTDTQSTSDIKAIGNYQGGSQNWGTFDDVRIYTRALSAAEVASIASSNQTVVNAPQDDRITSGLVGYWTFNGKDVSGSTASDVSGQGNNGTISNGASATIGKVGQAMSFDGVDDYVQVPYAAALAPTGALSFGGWFKTRDKTVSQKLISKTESGGYAMVINEGIGGCSGTSLAVFVGAPPANTYYGACHERSNFDNDEWHHAMGTYDGETLRLYFDGSLVNSNTSPSGAINYSTANTLCLGTEAGGTCGVTQFFPGSLDEVRVYNRALTDVEVRRLYLMGK